MGIVANSRPRLPLTRTRQQKLQKEEEKAARAAEKAAEEAAQRAAQQAAEEENKKRKEEERAKREAARKAADEERARQAEEKKKRQQEERELQQERERKRKEKEEKQKREREERERKAREEKEARLAKEREERAERERVERERREKEKEEKEKERQEREKKLAKEKEEREAKEKEKQAAQQRAAQANGVGKPATRQNAVASSSSSTTPVKQAGPSNMQRSPNTSGSNNVNGFGQKKQNNKPQLSIPSGPLGQGPRPPPLSQPPQQQTPHRPPLSHMHTQPGGHIPPILPPHLPPQAQNPMMFVQGQGQGGPMMVPPALSPRMPNFGPIPNYSFNNPNLPSHGPGGPLQQSGMPRGFPGAPGFDPSFNRGPPLGVALSMNNIPNPAPAVPSPIGPPSKPKTPLAPTPSSAVPPPMLAPGMGRRGSAPLDSSSSSNGPGPITRPAPIARPTTASTSTNGEGPSSGSGSPVRRSPSPKVLGSSALAADDDEVVSAPARRAPVPIGTSLGMGSAAPGSVWGASPSSPRTIGSGIIGANSPWGPPAPGFGAPGRPGPGSSNGAHPQTPIQPPPPFLQQPQLHGAGGPGGSAHPPPPMGGSSMWGTVPPANATPDWSHPLPPPGSATGFFPPHQHLFGMAQHNAAASSGNQSAS